MPQGAIKCHSITLNSQRSQLLHENVDKPAALKNVIVPLQKSNVKMLKSWYMANKGENFTPAKFTHALYLHAHIVN